MLEADTLALNPNRLVQALHKPADDFTKADIMAYIADQDIRMLNLRYLGGDGRLKQLNFVIQSKAQLDRLLTMGERVDGSSLFSFIDSNSSDLYVVPGSGRRSSTRSATPRPSTCSARSTTTRATRWPARPSTFCARRRRP